jgi:uncharacterized protein (DUF2132 family)
MPDAEPDEPKAQNDPLHGVTLKAMVEALQEKLGWDGLAEKIRAKCFMYEPSVQSSLVFLRRTPWAREKLEKLYLWTFHRPYLHKRYREKKGFEGPEAGKPPRKPEPTKPPRKPEPDPAPRRSGPDAEPGGPEADGQA